MRLAIANHKLGKAVVIPIILRFCHWEGTPIEELQVLPNDGRPINDWPDKDRAYLDIVTGIKKVIDSLNNERDVVEKQKVKFIVVNEDITKLSTDVVILKHANGFYGVDEMIAKRLVENSIITFEELSLRSGSSIILDSEQAITADKIFFLGVGYIYDFEYMAIRDFCFDSLTYLKKENLNQIESIGITLHGTGYGLDEYEALYNQIIGFKKALDQGHFPATLQKIYIVEYEKDKANRLKNYLRNIAKITNLKFKGPDTIDYQFDTDGFRTDEEVPNALTKKAYVSISDSKEFTDVYHFGIQGALHELDYLSEYLRQEYKLSELDQIRDKLDSCDLYISEITEMDPYITLELGYAIGHKVPTIILCRNDNSPIQNFYQNDILYYESIYELKSSLMKLLKTKKYK